MKSNKNIRAPLALLSLLIIGSAIFSACRDRPSELPLSTDLDLAQIDTYESTELGITFEYHKGWAVDEADATVYLAPSTELLPWGLEYFSSPREPYYKLYAVSPYSSFLDRLFGREQSIEEIAGAIASTFESGPIKGTLLEPISSLKADEYEAARLLISAGGLADYVVLIGITPNRVIAVSANGPLNQIEEMRGIVDDIVTSVRASK